MVPSLLVLSQQPCEVGEVESDRLKIPRKAEWRWSKHKTRTVHHSGCYFSDDWPHFKTRRFYSAQLTSFTPFALPQPSSMNDTETEGIGYHVHS